MKAEDLLKAIENNNTSGAAEITSFASECLLSFSNEFLGGTKEQYFKAMVDVGKRLIFAQPEMAPLFNLINEVLLTLEGRMNIAEDVTELKNLVIEKTSEFISRSKAAHKNIQKLVLDLISNDSMILTNSYSSTCIKSLLYAETKGKRMKVITLESRPMFEGRKAAKILSDHDIKTILIADMAAFSFLSDVDLVLTGCDTICYTGFVNKIGTLGLAVSAFQFNIPFYVLCERSKMLPSSYLQEPTIVKKDPGEIFQEPGKFKIHNHYFDVTPHKFATGMVTEDGMVAPSHVKELLNGLKVSSMLYPK
jgi:translation initiation factor 2B subunit (eIF-2B alpha/beta/delta family)